MKHNELNMPKITEEKEIELRKRSEEMLKYWIEFLAIILIGLFGTLWTVRGSFNILIIAVLIIIISVIMLFMFFLYNGYHKKTTNMIKNSKKSTTLK